MVVAFLAHLHKLDPAAKMVHDGLITLDIPPFDRHVVLAAGGDYPEWSVFSGQFLHLRIPRFLQRRNVNVAFERSGCDPEAKSIVQPMSETVKVMIRRLVASVDQRTLAINQLDTGIFFVQVSQIGILLPQIGAGRPHVRQESTGITPVQVSHGRGQHDNVARGVEAPQNYPFSTSPHKFSRWVPGWSDGPARGPGTRAFPFPRRA